MQKRVKMSSIDKLIQSLSNNSKIATFADLEKILKHYGWKLKSIKGSHHKFEKDGKIIILPRHKPMKEIYTKEVLERIKDENA